MVAAWQRSIPVTNKFIRSFLYSLFLLLFVELLKIVLLCRLVVKQVDRGRTSTVKTEITKKLTSRALALLQRNLNSNISRIFPVPIASRVETLSASSYTHLIRLISLSSFLSSCSLTCYNGVELSYNINESLRVFWYPEITEVERVAPKNEKRKQKFKQFLYSNKGMLLRLCPGVIAIVQLLLV